MSNVKKPEDRLSEIQLYELVADELEQGEQSKGLWAKALAEGEGNLEKAKGRYIALRVEMIKDEWAYAEKAAIELQKKQKKQAKKRRKEEPVSITQFVIYIVFLAILVTVWYGQQD